MNNESGPSLYLAFSHTSLLQLSEKKSVTFNSTVIIINSRQEVYFTLTTVLDCFAAKQMAWKLPFLDLDQCKLLPSNIILYQIICEILSSYSGVARSYVIILKFTKTIYFADATAMDNIFAPGTGAIFLDDVGCSGNETNLLQCPHRGIGISEPSDHYEDAGVICLQGAVVYCV